MNIIKDTTAMTYSTAMPVIEFVPPLPLRTNVKIPSHAVQKRNRLKAFKQKLDSLDVVEVPDCGLPRVYFKEIGT